MPGRPRPRQPAPRPGRGRSGRPPRAFSRTSAPSLDRGQRRERLGHADRGAANAGNGSAGNTLTFTYTAAAGGMANGAVTVTAPPAGARPRRPRAQRRLHDCIDGHRLGRRPDDHRQRRHARRRRDDDDRLRLHGRGRARGHGLDDGGRERLPTQQRSTGGGTLASIGASPSVNVYAADGSGTVTTPTANVVNGSTNTIVFTYKAAAAGGISNGAVTVTVPTGWPAPTRREHDVVARRALLRRADGHGVRTDARRQRDVHDHLRPRRGAHDRRPAGVVGDRTLDRRRRADRARLLAVDQHLRAPTAPARSPRRPRPVGFGSNGNTETFTYTAATGGTSNGSVTVVVPAGWNAPSTTAGNPGNTTSSTGAVSVAAQTITVSGVTLAGGATMTIVYGSGAPGATAPAAAGSTAWPAKSKASVASVLTSLGASPNITVAAAPASARRVPGRGCALRSGHLECRLREPGFCGTATDNSGAGLQKVELDDPPGHGELLGRKRLLERHARVRARDRYRDLVVRVPGDELLRRRRLHRPGARGRQSERCRDSVVAHVHRRPDAAERLLSDQSGRGVRRVERSRLGNRRRYRRVRDRAARVPLLRRWQLHVRRRDGDRLADRHHRLSVPVRRDSRV